MERWADDLSAINEVFMRVAIPLVHATELECALDRSEDLEGNIIESAEALSFINRGLITGIAESKSLARKLLNSDTRSRKIKKLAFHDPLTGLPNRMLFNDRLGQVLAQAERHGRGVTVMFVDLDKFKQVNDSYGHAAGDKVLQDIARRLQTSMRAEDTVSRYGGDEFACFMVEIKDDLAVAKIADKLINRISAAMELDGAQLSVSPSIGIAVYPKDGQSVETLLARADAAMYCAKRDGKGYLFFSDIVFGDNDDAAA